MVKRGILIIIFIIGITWIFAAFFAVQSPPTQVNIQEGYIITNNSSNNNPPSSFYLSDKKLNQEFCGSSECKFLHLYKVSEQESKAQIHLRQFAQMAQKLNRTLVLTNVGKSKIGSCLKYPLDYYYSLSSLQKMFPDLNFITQKQFYKWAKLRKQNPSSRQIIIKEDRKKSFHDIIEVQSRKFNLQRKLCSNEIKFNNINFYDLIIGGRYWTDYQKLNNLSNFIIENFKQFDDTEILLMEQEFYYPLFANITSSLEYAPHIINKAFTIIQNLQPFIAVQWRMETGNPLNMPKCAEKLVTHLEELKKKYNTKNVYLATDYPLNNSFKSFSFHNIQHEYHGKAIDILKDKVDFLSWFNYTPTDQFGKKMHINEFAQSGIPGILDKLVCSRAKIFLVAPPECRKKTSSYTSMIISERHFLMKAKVEGIENISSEW
ncbi:hypothetical protein C1645_766103 [Glomus cerebriforme]|uniref:Uncharacterized protein n=1 Tax=Glomus cerebriforme TaxID=658196 RepID=A0A397T2H4_9GLOM|nr:hypothetical protein C1645_766103 [Glomus cerebriforme]